MAEDDRNYPVLHIPFNLIFPSKLDLSGNLAANWRTFKRVWANYEIASGLNQKEMGQRTATLLTCLGPEALNIYDGLTFDDDNQRNNVDSIVQKFETFCLGETNETYERFCFNKRDQESDNVDTYVTVLRSLAKTCNYGALEDSLIRDRIVLGIRDNHTRKKLLQTANLTLRACIDICRASETTAAQVKNMAGVEEIKYVSKSSRDVKVSRRLARAPPSLQSSSPRIDCKFCTAQHPMRKELCPAWGKSCGVCKKLNHFAAKCPNKSLKSRGFKKKPKYNVNFVERSDSSDGCVMMIDSVNSVENSTRNGEKSTYLKRINAVMKVAEELIEFQLDSGSTINILPLKVYDKHCSNFPLTPPYTTLYMYNHSMETPIGKSSIKLTNPKNGYSYILDFLIVDADVKPILGSCAIQRMELITVNVENFEVNSTYKVDEHLPVLTLETVHADFNDVFTGDGCFDGKLSLELEKKTLGPYRFRLGKFLLL